MAIYLDKDRQTKSRGFTRGLGFDEFPLGKGEPLIGGRGGLVLGPTDDAVLRDIFLAIPDGDDVEEAEGAFGFIDGGGDGHVVTIPLEGEDLRGG